MSVPHFHRQSRKERITTRGLLWYVGVVTKVPSRTSILNNKHGPCQLKGSQEVVIDMAIVTAMSNV